MCKLFGTTSKLKVCKTKLTGEKSTRTLRFFPYVAPPLFIHLAPRYRNRLNVNVTCKNQIFGAEVRLFRQLPELINRYLLPPDPIILHYALNPGVAPPEKPNAYDVEIKVDDAGVKSRMTNVMVSTTSESMRDIVKLDEEVSTSFHFVIRFSSTSGCV